MQKRFAPFALSVTLSFGLVSAILDLVTVENWGEEKFRGSRREVEKWPPLYQPSTGQASNYNPRWRHLKPGLSSVTFQNNTCTAGYEECCYACSMPLCLLRQTGHFRTHVVTPNPNTTLTICFQDKFEIGHKSSN